MDDLMSLQIMTSLGGVLEQNPPLVRTELTLRHIFSHSGSYSLNAKTRTVLAYKSNVESISSHPQYLLNYYSALLRSTDTFFGLLLHVPPLVRVRIRGWGKGEVPAGSDPTGVGRETSS